MVECLVLYCKLFVMCGRMLFGGVLAFGNGLLVCMVSFLFLFLFFALGMGKSLLNF